MGQTINRESREIFVEDTLANLRERTFKLEECNSRHNSTVHAYSELLRMLNKRILPNGTCSNYNYFAYYNTVVLLTLHENLYLQSKKSYCKSHIYIVFNCLYSYLLKKGKYGKCDLYSYLHTSKCL